MIDNQLGCAKNPIIIVDQNNDTQNHPCQRTHQNTVRSADPVSTKTPKKRSFRNLSVCAHNVEISAKLKSFVNHIGRSIHYSHKLYILSMNKTTMEQDRAAIFSTLYSTSHA